MIRLTVLYPQTDCSFFDVSYYLDHHVPMARKLLEPFGLVRIELQEGLMGGHPEALPHFAMITGLVFTTTAELDRAVGKHGADLLSDLTNFTDVQPLVQVCRIL